ncbi:MAG: N-acetyltransferase family protein [Desulfuromonas sp.]
MNDTNDSDRQAEPDSVDIREMTIDDLAAVFHLGEQLFTSDFSPSMYRTWDEYEITTLFNSDNELCLVAELGGEVVGFALGTTVEKQHSAWKYGYLVWIGIRPGLQKCGAGHKLFAEIRQRMVEQGVRMIVIDTDADNKGGIRFFKKQGFGNIREHVYMTLNLSVQGKKRKKKHKKKDKSVKPDAADQPMTPPPADTVSLQPD